MVATPQMPSARTVTARKQKPFSLNLKCAVEKVGGAGEENAAKVVA
jgi:hypothetical protein